MGEFILLKLENNDVSKFFLGWLFLFFSIICTASKATEPYVIIPDCAVRYNRGIVDIHVAIKIPPKGSVGLLNLLCPNARKSKMCSGILVRLDFLKKGTIQDSVVKHLTSLKLDQITESKATIIWPNNRVLIDNNKNIVIWSTEGFSSKASCGEKIFFY